MTVLRNVFSAILASISMALALCMAVPASAQFYMQSPDFSGAPVRGDEPGIGVDLPGATDAELDAGLVWNLRAALNISALQCQFEPTLLTVRNYNSVMRDHAAELKSTYATLTKYFQRTNKSPKAAQTALDQFGTRVYGSFSTAAAQFGFCQVTAKIGRDALFLPRGTLHTLAKARMRELRNSLVPWGERRFPRGVGFDGSVMTPQLDQKCWDKKGKWVQKKCGADVQWVIR